MTAPLTRINRDTVVALCLLVLCAALWSATGEIRQTNYGTMQSDVWPRSVIIGLAVLSAVYLFRSLVAPFEQAPDGGREPGLRAWLHAYRNAVWCFVLFAAFLFAMEWVGMLVGGIAFVYLALTAMGERTVRSHLVHAVIAIVTMGLMWSIFTYGIGVILPEGELFLPE
jgi:hypothetical protein